MRTMLKDAPGGADFIRTLVAAASDMAQAFAGYPDDEVYAFLDRALFNMHRGIADELGPTAAAQIIVALKRTVMTQKAELEAKA